MVNIPKFENILEAIAYLDWEEERVYNMGIARNTHIIRMDDQIYKIYRNGQIEPLKSANANHSK